MTGFVRRHPLMSAILAFALLLTILSSVSIVPETRQGIVVRFGKPVRIVNRFNPGEQFGATQAGLNFTIPFAEDVVWIDKRVRDVDMERQQVLSTDQRRLVVDAFARYRIVDPLLMFIRARNEQQLNDQLRPILGSEVRNELGKRSFASLLTPERVGVMGNVRRSLNTIARQYGAEIVDVRIKKTDLPSGTPLQSAFLRMRSAREQEARSIRAEGAKQAQIIRAQADADAAKTYAASFGKDAQFYDFYRAMQSYMATFVGDGSEKSASTSVILSPQNDYLREFNGRSR